MALPPAITDNAVTLPANPGGFNPPNHTYYGYCVVAQAQQEIPGDLLATMTNTNQTAWAQVVTYAAIEVQNQLARFYVMPYTGTDQGILLALSEMNAKMAAAEAINRYYRGAEPQASAMAAALRGYVEALVTDLEDGRIRWQFPFGDAVPNPEMTVYPLAAGATIQPSPFSSDIWAAAPIFSMGTNRYRGRNRGLI